MAIVNQIDGDMHVRGALTATTLTPSSGAVTNGHVNASAAIAATKMQHQYEKVYAQESATAAADESRVIHVVYGATGTIVTFKAGSVAANVGDSTVTVDLEKNGVSVLTAAITLDNTNAAFTPEAGTIDSASVSDGDVLEVVIDATVGTGTLAKGVYGSLIIREDAA